SWRVAIPRTDSSRDRKSVVSRSPRPETRTPCASARVPGGSRTSGSAEAGAPSRQRQRHSHSQKHGSHAGIRKIRTDATLARQARKAAGDEHPAVKAMQHGRTKGTSDMQTRVAIILTIACAIGSAACKKDKDKDKDKTTPTTGSAGSAGMT